MEPNFDVKSYARVTEEELFPLHETLLCLYCRNSLGEPSVQAVLVRPDGRCPAYECDEARYMALHGAAAPEDEDLYALNPLSCPAARRSAPLNL